jgi:hydroxyacylglutathione hydrolase
VSTTWDVDISQLAAALETDNPPLLVDTRSRREYAAEHIPGAVHLPFWRAGARHAELAADPDTHIVLYCGHGPRAQFAQQALQRRGYRCVGLLRGHFQAWKDRS